mmetsp:Transcript_26640/g.37537  ORF Transcript_26640/g.37537 Transcript_26640/m.37537 type:complete len:448 (-) Transcript_26640:167-1510(-)
MSQDQEVPPDETTPLSLAQSESLPLSEDEVLEQNGSATFAENIINTAKTCIGTGALALPFAARQGGIIVNCVGLVGIACWNLYSIKLLLNCLDLLPHPNLSKEKRDQPPDGTSTLGKVAFQALGRAGLHTVDITMLLLLLGIIIAYISASISFLNDTPLTVGNWNGLVVAIIIGLFSNVPDMGYLAKLSAMGLTTLFVSFVVIACYGDFSGFSLNLWPLDGLSGVSHWFGCTVFSFGTVPLTYNLRDSMLEPRRMMSSTSIAFGLVTVSYLLLGSGMLLLYPDVEGDVLKELPSVGHVPTAIRLAMTLVVLATAPLLVVPCGEVVEGKLFHGSATPSARVGIRLAICIACTVVGIGVPGFVEVLSFVGCCCVAVVSFVVPPLLHILLSWQRQSNYAELPVTKGITTGTMYIREACSQNWLWIDSVMLLWGVTASFISTMYTFRTSYQ